MEIRVFCNKLVTLNNFNDLKLIRLNVLSYNLKHATLNGDVKISGEYLKEENYEMGFEEIVPFTVVFRNDKIKVNNIIIENDNYNVIINQGIDVSFELVVNYELTEEEQSNNGSKEELETEEENIIEVPVEITDDFEKMIGDQKNDVLLEVEKITEEYDKLLSNILNVRCSNEDNNVVLSQDKRVENNKVNFKKLQSNYNKLSIYYINKESELELISKEKRISINEIYKQNTDFEKTRRIILNE